MFSQILKKVCEFFLKVAKDGFLAIVLAGVLYVCLAVIFLCFMIPVYILHGQDMVMEIVSYIGYDRSFAYIYIMVYGLMILDDLGLANVKSIFWKNRGRATI